MLITNGLFCFTCASTGRAEHGTRRSSPGASFGTIGNLADMFDYYKNLTVDDLNNAVSLNEKFSCWNSYYNSCSRDLYFVGIKRSDEPFFIDLKEYHGEFIKNTTF